jgi:hypothetical protein
MSANFELIGAATWAYVCELFHQQKDLFNENTIQLDHQSIYLESRGRVAGTKCGSASSSAASHGSGVGR